MPQQCYFFSALGMLRPYNFCGAAGTLMENWGKKNEARQSSIAALL